MKGDVIFKPVFFQIGDKVYNLCAISQASYVAGKLVAFFIDGNSPLTISGGDAQQLWNLLTNQNTN